jgi:NAD-dependent dihydropyrimidine dehydrogenase PreA subunit
MPAKKIMINDNCIACGACAMVCPINPTVMYLENDKTTIKHPDKCIQCGECANACPVNAIVVEKKNADV